MLLVILQIDMTTINLVAYDVSRQSENDKFLPETQLNGIDLINRPSVTKHRNHSLTAFQLSPLPLGKRGNGDEHKTLYFQYLVEI